MDPYQMDPVFMGGLMQAQPMQYYGGGGGSGQLGSPLVQQQQQIPQLNNLYKTQLCKHFQQAKHCHVGNKCHFAHGEHELRKKEDPLPIEVQMKMLNIPYNNYKTQRCKYFEQEGQCKFGKNCSYAHGDTDLRNPYDSVSIQAMMSQYAPAGPNYAPAQMQSPPQMQSQQQPQQMEYPQGFGVNISSPVMRTGGSGSPNHHIPQQQQQIEMAFNMGSAVGSQGGSPIQSQQGYFEASKSLNGPLYQSQQQQQQDLVVLKRAFSDQASVGGHFPQNFIQGGGPKDQSQDLLRGGAQTHQMPSINLQGNFQLSLQQQPTHQLSQSQPLTSMQMSQQQFLMQQQRQQMNYPQQQQSLPRLSPEIKQMARSPAISGAGTDLSSLSMSSSSQPLAGKCSFDLIPSFGGWQSKPSTTSNGFNYMLINPDAYEDYAGMEGSKIADL